MLARMICMVAFAAAGLAVPAQMTRAQSIEEAGQATSASELAREADLIMATAYAPDQPGAAAIVMRGNRVVWSSGRGLADVGTVAPITPGTAFRVGSITKQFTAAVILQLVAEGRISLDDPISRFFPDWPGPGAGATIRQLLNHSSGLPEFTEIPGYMEGLVGKTVATSDLIAAIRGQPAPTAPGAAWRYNNSGYVVLGAIIEQVEGAPWHQAVDERIARPLGLTSLAYGPAAQGEPNLALPFSREDDRFAPARGVDLSVAHAAGSLILNVRDFARWNHALHHGQVVRPDLYALMTGPGALADGSPTPYGFGLHLIRFLGRPAYRHGGAARGVDAGSVYIPSEDLFVAVLANSDDLASDASVVVRRLAALALGRPFPLLSRADVPDSGLETLQGSYAAERGPELSFTRRGERLYLGIGEETEEIFSAGGDRFFFGPDQLAWIEVDRRPAGDHVVTVHLKDGAELRAVRTGEAAAVVVPLATLRAYAGVYSTEGPTLTIALDGDRHLTLAAGDEAPQVLRPVSPGEFRIDGRPLRVVFHTVDGRTDALTLTFGPREFRGVRIRP